MVNVGQVNLHGYLGQQQPQATVCQVREEVSQQVEAARQELVAENRVRSLDGFGRC